MPNQSKTETDPDMFYSLGEEIANAVTHGIGALLSVAALTLMVVVAVLQDDGWKLGAGLVYGISLVGLFLASTLYHGVQGSMAKRILQLFDHCAIYVLIAGTYTPFLLISLRGAWGYSLMAVIWSLALFGVTFTLIYRTRFPRISLFTYVAMGWLIIVASTQLYTHVPLGGLVLLGAGGLAYTLGVIFYVWERLPFNHAVWHVFVLGGSIFHFLAVFLYLYPDGTALI